MSARWILPIGCVFALALSGGCARLTESAYDATEPGVVFTASGEPGRGVGEEWPHDITRPDVYALTDGSSGVLGVLQNRPGAGWVVVDMTPNDPKADAPVLARLDSSDASRSELVALQGTYVWAVGRRGQDEESPTPVIVAARIARVDDSVFFGGQGGSGVSGDSQGTNSTAETGSEQR